MTISTDQVKELREKTGISVMQCRKALEEADGDMEKALIILRKKGAEISAKKASRNLGAGTVAAYIHSNGNVGAMVELSSETDFVSKNEEFKALAYDIAMHIAALNPEFIHKDEITQDSRDKAAEVFQKELEGKPKEMHQKIMEGKLNSYFADRILLEQAFIKDGEKTIGELIEAGIQKFGEKIEVARFARFSVLDK
ncbi:MAG TPA: elongation factor Ts [Candidatus Paceibacterota bacterium]|nr:elongation factor Ts [Candidatus Paceibacterota bacterium]